MRRPFRWFAGRFNRSTVAGRRKWSRLLAGAFVALILFSLPVAAWTSYVGIRLVLLPRQEQAAAASASFGAPADSAEGGAYGAGANAGAGGDAGAEEAARRVDDFDRLEAARTRAVEFSTEYLTLDLEEDEELAVERIGGLLHPDLDPENVVPVPPSQSRQRVLASFPIYARPLEDDVIEVHTRNRVLTEPLEDKEEGQGDQAGGQQGSKSGTTGGPTDGNSDGAADANEDGDAAAEAQAVSKPIVQRLAVYVGVDDKGRPAIVDPPALLEGSGGYSGPPGVLDFSETAAEDLNPDGKLATRLDGYLAAIYGREESRKNLERFFVDGAEIPRPPSERLEFLEITDANLRPRVDEEGEYVAEEIGGQTLVGVYDVELWVAARADGGKSAGMVVNQTHLVTAGLTEDGEWLLVGER